GYYSRARNLHKAAKQIAESGFPQTFEGVRSLAGVGDYTAGAICSIAYNLPCPAVDGNVLRVLTRLLADESNIDDMKTRAEFSKQLKEVYPAEAGDFCQALMELGAIVCVPNGKPLCGECPWQNICKAHLSGEEERYPVRGEKRARKIVNAEVLVLCREGKYALEKRADKGLLAGLWQFPFFEGSAPSLGKCIKTKRATHIFTHVEWHMTGKLIEADTFYPQYVWATAEEIKKSYAIPSAFKAFMEWID
ncbi:MAG: NUDIX domain-containing protein, partial [Clostridiales bacterium]|nr:NUDIX domain-containing protein [Clostridiales bacterium]